MRRQLSIVSIAVLAVLLLIGISKADIITPDRTAGLAGPNDRLLITPRHSVQFRRLFNIASEETDTFESQMARNGWNIMNPSNRAFYNVRKIIQRQELMRMQDDINAKVFEARRQSDAIDRSA